MKVAALDLGSNTFLCLIAEVQAGKIVRIHADDSKVVRLGEKITESGVIQPSALNRAGQCFSEFRALIDQHQVEKTCAMATSAARSAKNRDEFLGLAREFGFAVEVIDGQKEAETTFLGAFEEGVEPCLVIDIGGGSTEFGYGPKGVLSERVSIELGCVRLFETWGVGPQMPINEFESAQEKLGEIFKEKLCQIRSAIKTHLGGVRAVAVAGTPVELSKVIFETKDIHQIHGRLITAKALDEALKKVLSSSPEELTHRFGVLAGRADVLLSGALILKTALEVLELDQVDVSTRGLRHGIAILAAQEKSS